VLTARVAATARSPERAEARRVPYGPDGEQIKRHLVHCLEMHHGDRSTAVVPPDEAALTCARSPSRRRTIAERSAGYLARLRRARTFAYPDPACQVQGRQPLMRYYIQFVRIRENRIAIHLEATSRGMQDTLDP
jgi:hypothetical protein